MTTDTYLCPCRCQRTVRVRDNAGVYHAEFRDDRGHEVAQCKCGENIYEMLAAGRLRELPEPPAKGARHVSTR